MIRNRELFDKIADQIEQHPETYDQNHYRCGTAHCVAGHAVAISGLEMSQWDTEAAARELLGLTDDEGDTLFNMYWRPPAGMTVPEALRAIGRGEIDP